MSSPASDPNRLIDVELDESIGRSTPDVEHERAVAIFDLIEDNSFKPVGDADGGPYKLKLSLIDARLVFAVTREDGAAVVTHILSLTPFRSTLRDYFATCETYFASIRMASPEQIEAIDEMRRQIHNDGATLLMERLQGKVEMDFDTARRLFTVIKALRWKG